MPSQCPVCALVCPNFFSYQMHREICQAVITKPKRKRFLSGVKKPLTDERISVIINRLETKLGKEKFFGD